MYSKGSHKKIIAECSSKISDKCVNKKEMVYKDFRANQQRNNGKYICLYCSRKLKYSGRNNPNVRYKTLIDNYFEEINTSEKAYILGFIAGDGCVTGNRITIKIHSRDIDILAKIRNEICDEIDIDTYGVYASLVFSSTKLCDDVCRHLNITQGKKSDTLSKPNIPEEFYYDFIRGFFDADGSITDPVNNKKNYIRTNITTNSTELKKWLFETVNIPGYQSDTQIEWSCNNALDFLGIIYEDATIYLNRKYQLYKMWCSYVAGIGTSLNIGPIKVLKTRKDAVLPNKSRVSDSGYDLVILEKIKEVGDVEFFTTGVKVQLDMGWYSMVVPRSSISKTGYMLANSVGIIDRTYLGEIIIALRKVDKTAKDIELPCRIAQLIPMPIVHMNVSEVDELNNTNRGEAGFGSTGD